MRNCYNAPLVLAVVIAVGLAGCGKKPEKKTGPGDTAPRSRGGTQNPPSDTPQQRESRRTNLRFIGAALHQHHDTFRRFPAIDSNGAPKGPNRKAGLSWRVHLLPFLDHRALYERFKLDEPWDSPHNKQLISQMPEIFASPGFGLDRSAGKTCFRVFVGKNTTPFGIERDNVYVGAGIRDIIDGTSNTILLVEAGPSRAEIWTKPTGLPFDASQNPFDALGNIPEDGFLAVFCDGATRMIERSTSPDLLKLLIQHNDRQPVPQK